MTPERWRRVTEVFHAAVARTPAARAAFLEETCHQDMSLRADVAALLAEYERPAFDDEPAFIRPVPHFDSGVSLGRFRLDGLVGAGGMGEVYRATDRREQRTVAIKVLQPEHAADPAFHRRSEREAQLLASLNHPNIGAIHGFEELDGVHALVLEFVEGSTLAERLEGGRLPVEEALGIARQITFGLEAAHEKDIVHRDLKPANIKITPDGVVKILDFGIAKGPGGRSTPATAPSRAPTTGIILGTAGYISPEQARGREVDRRTDIWAFGCVLFEMLTGRSPFAADTTPDTIARILEHDPPWHMLPADVPEVIQKLLRQCLQKDANARLNDIADARLAIADVMALPKRRAPGVPLMTPARWLGLGLGLAALAAVVMLVSPWGRTAAGLPVELGITLPENVVAATGVAVSPDGRRIAAGVIGGPGQIWIHSLDTGSTQPVPRTEGGTHPFWSPDSRRLAFFQGGVLRALTLADGAMVDLCKVKNVPAGGTWTADGRIVIALGGQLFEVPATGGEPKLLKQLRFDGFAMFPQMHPDGRQLLFFTRDRGTGWATVAALDSGQSRRLVETGGAPVFAGRDRLLYVRGASIVAQGFDTSGLALAGEPRVVGNAVGPGALTESAALATVSVSPTGVLAFITQRGGRPGRLTWFDRSGRAEGSIKSIDGEYLNPAISPNADLVAANRMDPQTGNWDIWVIDANGVETKLTSDSAVESDPIWSPDGKDIVFTSGIGGQLGLYRQPIDGSGPVETLHVVKGASTLAAAGWTRDEKSILYSLAGPDPGSIWTLPLTGDRRPTRLLAGHSPRLSPDGQWLAYVSGETGAFEIHVQRFPKPVSKHRISEGGGVHPRWISDGRELVYWAIPGGLNVVNIIDGAAVGDTRTIVHAPVLGLVDGRTHYDASRDGRRFIVRQPAGRAGPAIKVVRNWK